MKALRFYSTDKLASFPDILNGCSWYFTFITVAQAIYLTWVISFEVDPWDRALDSELQTEEMHIFLGFASASFSLVNLERNANMIVCFCLDISALFLALKWSVLLKYLPFTLLLLGINSLFHSLWKHVLNFSVFVIVFIGTHINNV